MLSLNLKSKLVQLPLAQNELPYGNTFKTRARLLRAIGSHTMIRHQQGTHSNYCI
jgi:hypothetical protein